MKKIKGFFILSTMFISFSVVSCGGGNNNPTPTPVTLTALSVSASDKDYLVGDYLYQDELKVYAIYSNNTYKTVTDFTCPELSEGYYTFESAKTYTFNISYGGKTEQLKIKAKNSPSDKDDYTLLIYMCASTLESNIVEAQERSGYTTTAGYASLDLQEILSTCTATPNNVNVVIRTGGTSKWGNLFDGIIDVNHIQTFHVHNHDLVEDTSARIEYDARTKTVTMSDKDRLKDFINYGKTNYPADKTALILWDHGGGMSGVCQDTRYIDIPWVSSFPCLMNSDVDYALETSFPSSNKLEWIGYDACLMAVQDVADFNSNHAKYMIASQENEPAKGWKYDSWLNKLYKNVDIDTVELLKEIQTSYISDNGPTAMMSVLNLNLASKYKTAWNNLSKTIYQTILSDEGKQDQWDLMVKVINTPLTLRFGREEAYVLNEQTSEFQYESFYTFGLYDIINTLKILNKNYKRYTELTSAINNVLNVLTNDKYVVSNQYGAAYTEDYIPCGLSFFCPTEKSEYRIVYPNDDNNFAASASWYSKTETPFITEEVQAGTTDAYCWYNLCQTYGQWWKGK